MPPGTSTVEITLRADGDATVLRMVHSGFVDADMAASHGEGWDRFLPRFVAVDQGPAAATRRPLTCWVRFIS